MQFVPIVTDDPSAFENDFEGIATGGLMDRMTVGACSPHDIGPEFVGSVTLSRKCRDEYVA